MAYSDNFPKRLLDSLTERVCRPIQKLSTRITTGTPLWNGPIEMCEQLEKDPLSVDSVIVSARTLNGNFSGVNILFYHAVLCRVYILLRYRHGEDEVYKTVVYPRLLENMGAYGKPDNLKPINEQVDRVKELEALVAKAGKTDVQPVFEYVPHFRSELDHLFNEYGDESLFRGMVSQINHMSTRYGTNLDEANVWFNAKQVLKAFKDVRRPGMFIERAATSLKHGQISNDFNGSQEILLCVYAMVRASKHNEHFANFIVTMEELAYNPTNLSVIHNEIESLKSMMDKFGLSDDYDYIGDEPEKKQMFTRDEMERAFNDYKKDYEKQLTKKDKELEVQRKELEDKQLTIDRLLKESEKKEEELEDVKEGDDVLYNKVSFEMFLKLLEKADFDINNTGNKTRAGGLWHMMTAKSADDLRRYSSTRNYDNNHTKKDIERLNNLLSEMGVTNIRL